MVQWFVENDPDQFTKVNMMGMLPIHVACRSGASRDVVWHLLTLLLGSVRAKTTDPRERLPIGCAWQCHGIDHEIICFLLEIDPESDSVSDG
jgi:hypothetical protein